MKDITEHLPTTSPEEGDYDAADQQELAEFLGRTNQLFAEIEHWAQDSQDRGYIHCATDESAYVDMNYGDTAVVVQRLVIDVGSRRFVAHPASFEIFLHEELDDRFMDQFTLKRVQHYMLHFDHHSQTWRIRASNQSPRNGRFRGYDSSLPFTAETLLAVFGTGPGGVAFYSRSQDRECGPRLAKFTLHVNEETDHE
jgi:hypothetical protein